jgi:hypothetical protein
MFQIFLNTYNGLKRSGTPNDVMFSLTSFPPDKTVKYKLVRASIPNLRYPVNSSNNVLVYTGTASGSITIPSGSYTGNLIASVLQAALITATGIAALTVTYSNTTSMLTFATNGVQTFGLGSTSTIGRILGFASSGTTATTSITSIYPVRLDGPLFVDVVISGLKLETYSDSPSAFNKIIARIPLTENFGGIIYYEPTLPTEFTTKSTDLLRFSIMLVDDLGLDFTLPVTADCEYVLQCSVEAADQTDAGKKRKINI